MSIPAIHPPEGSWALRSSPEPDTNASTMLSPIVRAILHGGSSLVAAELHKRYGLPSWLKKLL